MLVIEGTVIQPGLKIGRARKIQPREWDIPRQAIGREEIDTELRLLHNALTTVEREIEQHLFEFKGAEEDKEILSSHLLILRDPELIPKIRATVSARLVSAALAVREAFSEVRSRFNSMSNEYFAQRAADYKDVQHRLLAEITGHKHDDMANWEPDQIAVLTEVTPSQVSGFARHQVPAWCSEQGSFTSHASILSRSLQITAVTGLPELCDKVSDGDRLILDGLDGRVIIKPDPNTVLLYEQLLEKYREKEEESRRNLHLPVQTLEGRRIKLRCNLDLLTEVDLPAKLGADGIGLYRTEFHYLGRDELPSEDTLFGFYREVAEKAAPHSVTIRSFDLGGDKLSHLIPANHEENPYLGLRGIRFSLARQEVFRNQVRAVLRASHYGRIKLMFPMVADLRDFLKAREVVWQCQRELRSEGVPYDAELALGVMIEIPSAALCADELAEKCDFFSIGTNDLVQYTLAADRNNPALADYYTTHHPAVLQLLRLTLEAASRHGKPVSICGEMASQPEYIPLLIGMGFSELSVGTSSYLQCKNIIRRCDAALTELVGKTDLSANLATIEYLVFHQLKPYYHIV
ncbi:MAG: phosphoenolpyruvate--protein phosphotransferase [Candidatus Syntrophosphaera sp.]|nr:phosphoenolpyruvate--protein phosphotransferase [Candidatus Syntrophosphaera sp.]